MITQNSELSPPARLARRGGPPLATAPSRKRSVSHGAIARRARLVVWAKRVLPAVALILLTCIVMWPEFSRLTEAGRLAVRRMSATDPLGGRLVDAHYRGIDQHGRPYTITAETGQQVTPEQILLAAPKADMTLESGRWTMLQGDHGVYLQHAAQLDLQGHVVMYRDDGMFLRTETTTMDLKTGFAAGSHVVSVEGPAGQLDATGFALADKGALIQFTGPARAILNAKNQ